jgi:hypothetical protein
MSCAFLFLPDFERAATQDDDAAPDTAADTVDRMNAQFLTAFDAISATAAGLTAVKPLPVSLSTCTFAGRLAFADGAAGAEEERRFGRVVAGLYDTVDLLESMGDEASEFKLVRDAPVEGEDDDDDVKDPPARKRAAPPKKKFHNQVSLRRGTKSIKMFKNGSVHGTGCPSPVLFYDMVDSFCAFLDTIYDLPAAVFLKSFRIGMINAMFVINDPEGRLLKIKLEALTNRLAGQPEVEGVGRIEQNLESHPGAKIPLFLDPADRSKKITIRIFQTGSVYIAGAREPAHLARAHAHACKVLDDNAAEVCYPDVKTALRSTTAKQHFELTGGYVRNQFEACCTGEAYDRAAAASIRRRRGAEIIS